MQNAIDSVLGGGSDVMCSAVRDGSAKNETLIFPFAQAATMGDLDGDGVRDMAYPLQSAWVSKIVYSAGLGSAGSWWLWPSSRSRGGVMRSR